MVPPRPAPRNAATVNKTLVQMQGLGMIAELTHKQRGRVFAYEEYVALLNAERAEAPAFTPA